MRTIDLFCGCGGLSYGFQKEGFDIIAAYDNWPKAITVYNDNFSHKATLQDVLTLDGASIKKLNPDIIIGGPPCQDYSSAGKRDESLGRANLTLVFAQLVCNVKPKWFVMENVDRIVKSITLPKAIKMYKNVGYGLTQIILDASRCGVPQKRKRFFLIGELHGVDDFIKQELIVHQSATSMTLFDYLGNEFKTKYYYRHPRSYLRRGIFSIYEPSPTIRGVNRPIPPSYKIRPNDATSDLSQVKVLSTEERFRIQTFPKEFKLSGSKTDLEQIAGNAVPVELAAYVAKILKIYIDKTHTNKSPYNADLPLFIK